jgi:hypothetical protein
VKNTVQRLAGESQMVGPEITDIEAWRRAAQESTANTAKIVNEQVGQGEDSVQKTRKLLVALQAKRTALNQVKETM